MDTTKPLTNLTILNTRPETFAKQLTQTILELGGQSVQLPTIEIEPIPFSPPTENEHYDLIIFVSRNAVIHGRTILPNLGAKWIAAIGPKTADEANKYGVKVNLCPTIASSEGMLSTLQPISGISRVLIIKGAHGLTTLEDGLKRQGKTVHLMSVYKRVRPKQFEANFLKKIVYSPHPIDIILVSSLQSLETLTTQLKVTQPSWLPSTSWIVLSERIAIAARANGLTRVVITKEPSFFNALSQWPTIGNNYD